MNDENKLTVYSYNDDEYFVGFEIATLLGYKSPKDAITHNVSNYNKIHFREYLGVKEPPQDPRVILIKKDGIKELLSKTRKKISNDTLNMLKDLRLEIVIKSTVKKENVELKDNTPPKENKLTCYSYVSNHLCFEYFVGFEVASFLGYKNPSHSITHNVSKCNQLLFKDYPDIKEPSQDPRTILITKNGIEELLSKTRKKISNDNLNTLIKITNISSNTKKCEKTHVINEITNISSNTNENTKDLTTYSYISNHLCFEYFVGFEITTLLGYKSPHHAVSQNVSKCNQLLFKNYPGVKKPIQENHTILITRDGAIEILLKTRKKITPDVLHFLKEFGIETTNKKCLTKEQQTLSAIGNAFKTEKIEDQYKIGKYYLDLYFPQYKLVVECDENGHSDRKPHLERERMDFVNEKLEIDDSHWIRYNPDEYDFDLSKVIGRIYREIKEQNSQKTTSDDEESSEEKPSEDEEKYPELDIQEVSCKYLAPPKDFLVKELKKHSVTKIAQKFGISTNPIYKWLDQYSLDLKDFKQNTVPTKEELEELLSVKSQTEVANEYNVSCHVVRQWAKKYGTSTSEIRKKAKTLTKTELITLVNEKTVDEIAEDTGMTENNVKKLIKQHSIDKIPPKEEIEKLLKVKSKEELAKHFNTTRTTLRKWLKSYDLYNIRTETASRPLYAISEETGDRTRYSSVKEVCKTLHITHSKVYDAETLKQPYKGYTFVFE